MENSPQNKEAREPQAILRQLTSEAIRTQRISQEEATRVLVFLSDSDEEAEHISTIIDTWLEEFREKQGIAMAEDDEAFDSIPLQK